MTKKRYFFQDFLFEDVPIDKNDYPIVNMATFPSDINKGSCIAISLDKMMRMNKLEEWKNLFKQIDNQDVYIQDDVPLQNLELEYYKNFYLRTYYYNLSKYCKNIFLDS